MILFGSAGPWIEKAYKTLVYRRFPHDLRSGQVADACDQRMRLGACTLDQLGYAEPSQLAQRCIGGDGTTAP